MSVVSQPDTQPGATFNTGFASLSEFDATLDGPTVLARIAPAMARCLRDFPQGGFAAWTEAYARRDLTLGQPVSAGALEGIARGVAADGSLQIDTAQGLQSVSAGEVSLRLSPPPAAPTTGR